MFWRRLASTLLLSSWRSVLKFLAHPQEISFKNNANDVSNAFSKSFFYR